MLLSNIPQYIECKKIYNYGKKNKQFFHLSTNSKTIKKVAIKKKINAYLFNNKIVYLEKK